jgi:hypothetical protein
MYRKKKKYDVFDVKEAGYHGDWLNQWRMKEDMSYEE